MPIPPARLPSPKGSLERPLPGPTAWQASTDEEEETMCGEQSLCTELLVHLLSLSHRLAPRASRVVGGENDDDAEDGEHYQCFVWQTDLCPPALATAARAALRAAVTLICDQEMRAAQQMRRPSAALPTQRRGKQGGGGTRLLGSVATAAAEHERWLGEAWTHRVHLRRLRERMQRALPLHLELLAQICTGRDAVVQVWAEAIWAAVIEPVQELCQTMPVTAQLAAEALVLCLEHRRIEILLCAAVDRAESDGAAAGAPAVDPGGADPGAEHSADDGPGDVSSLRVASPQPWSYELSLICDRSWYSPYVFEWLKVASAHIEQWLADALHDETMWRGWRPLGTERQSQTLHLLFRVCSTLVQSLRRFGVFISGEAVTAAQAIADHHATFISALEAAAAEVREDATGLADGGRTVFASKAAGATVGVGLTSCSRGVYAGTNVVISYIHTDSVLANLIRPAEVRELTFSASHFRLLHSIA